MYGRFVVAIFGCSSKMCFRVAVQLLGAPARVLPWIIPDLLLLERSLFFCSFLRVVPLVSSVIQGLMIAQFWLPLVAVDVFSLSRRGSAKTLRPYPWAYGAWFHTLNSLDWVCSFGFFAAGWGLHRRGFLLV